MAESSKKRSRRTDSAAMWDTNSSDRPSRDHKDSRSTRDRSRSRERPSGGRGSRGDKSHRHRSRSRSHDRRRERSRSRDRGGMGRGGGRERGGREDRDRDGDRVGKRKERERSRSREGVRGTSRDRTRAPKRDSNAHRSRSPRAIAVPPTGSRISVAGPKAPPHDDAMDIDAKASPATGNGDEASKKPKKAKQEEEDDEETAIMRKQMGFAKFRTTKQTKVPGNNVYAVRKEKKAEYRQYMNRQGGFNRPLSPSR